MKIAAIDAIPLTMSFLPEVSPHMLRAATHGTALSFYRVTLDNGVEGYGGDVDSLRALAGLAREFHKPFWIQTVGTSLRAAWLAHLASTGSEALLSHMAAHDLWVSDVARPPKVVDGWVQVSDAPGLGVLPDPAAIEQLRNAPPTPKTRRVSTVVYPSGVRWHFADEMQRHEAFYFGHLPGFSSGVHLEVTDDDGSPAFDHLWTRCRIAPVVD